MLAAYDPNAGPSVLTLTRRLAKPIDRGGGITDFAGGWRRHLDLPDGAAAGLLGAFDLRRFGVLRTTYAATL